jgi:hypothetical protein
VKEDEHRGGVATPIPIVETPAFDQNGLVLHPQTPFPRDRISAVEAVSAE